MKLSGILSAMVCGPVAGVAAAALVRSVEAGIHVLVSGIHRTDGDVVIPAYGEIALFTGVCWLYMVPMAALLQRSRFSSAVLSSAIATPPAAVGLWFSDLARFQAKGIPVQGAATTLVAILVPVLSAVYVSLALCRRSRTSGSNAAGCND